MNSRRTPFDEMDRAFESMRRSMENMMGGMGGTGRSGRWNADDDAGRMGRIDGDSMGRLSAMDGDAMGEFRLEEIEGGYVLLADVPGFEKSEIDITLDGRDLTLAAEHEIDEETEGRSFRQRRSLRRSITLPEGIRTDDVSATYRNGVLEISLPADVDGDATHVQID